MTEVEKLLASYEEWCREREDIAERDAMNGASTDDWNASDDSAVSLMHQMAGELRGMPEYRTIEEVATYMRVSRMTVYRLTASGELPAVKFGRSFRVSEVDFQEYLAKNTTGRP